MGRLLQSGLRAALVAASLAALPPAAAASNKVVSINLCADQLAVMLLEPSRIAALSALARDPALSFVAAAASNFPLVREDAEEVLALQPDLVLAGDIGARPTIELLKRFGVSVHEVAMVASFAGIRAQVLALGRRLGVETRAQSLIDEMDRALQAAAGDAGASAAFFLPNGFSAGSDTLGDAILTAAGFRNHAAALGLKGYGALPLEMVVRAPPELLVSESGDDAPSQGLALLRHPALARQLPPERRVAIPSRLSICAGPQTAEAVKLLAARR